MVGIDRAWEISEKNALKRRMEKKQRDLEDDKMVLKKRQKFLNLVKKGLSESCKAFMKLQTNLF